jgi:hypothetical protein
MPSGLAVIQTFLTYDRDDLSNTTGGIEHGPRHNMPQRLAIVGLLLNEESEGIEGAALTKPCSNISMLR